jgi:hypothetical protein
VIRVLNLGAGTQSSVLLLMSDRGEIDPVDVAIFADTGWEPKQVYEHLEWLKAECKTEIVTVQAGNILDDAMVSRVRGKAEDGNRWASMPFFVDGQEGKREGMIRRQCTKEYKIDPIRRYIKTEILGLSPTSRWPKELSVEQWFGLSVDECHRMRAPEGKWVKYRYPLIEMRWPRSRAINWAEDNYPERSFVRSACCGCPFRTDREWQWLKDNDPDGFASAVSLDETIRHAGGMRGDVYLHRSLLPIAEINFDKDADQMSLWQDECEGMCGV